MNEDNRIRRHPLRPWNDPVKTYIEVPNPEEWQALVARASEERAIPEPPPPRNEPGEWVFRGYDQLGQDVWSWRAIPEPTEGQNRGE